MGFISLELARNGCLVTGIDISKESIKVANKYSEENTYKQTFGSLEYCLAEGTDFLKDRIHEYDAIVFYGVLHHFDFFELKSLCELMKASLKPDGIVAGYEPCYDRFNESNATLLYLIKVLMSKSDCYYEKIQMAQNERELMELIRKELLSAKQISEDLEKEQSVKDFSSGYSDMVTALSYNFEKIEIVNDHGFFELFAGGMRDEYTEIERMAQFFSLIDKKLVELGTIQPLSFMFAGKKI